MAIPFLDDLIAWLYQFLRRIGWVLTFAGLLLGAVMMSVWFGTGEWPHWSALELNIPSPHTSISPLDSLITAWWTAKLGVPLSLFAMGMSLNLSFGRWARQMAEADAELYEITAAQRNPASFRTRWTLRFPTHKRHREPQH